jgi:hypothetical protein
VINAKRTSHSLSGEDDNQAEQKTAEQHQRGSGSHIMLATLPAAPIKRQWQQHAKTDYAKQ